MKRHLNTLFVTTQGTYLAKEGQTVVVKVDGEVRMQLPTHNLGSIVCFGQVSVSPFLLGHCAENAVGVSFLSEHGRFLARVQGATSGNVLLRREQYRRADDREASARVARAVVSAKVANCRVALLRGQRDRPEGEGAERLRVARPRHPARSGSMPTGSDQQCRGAAD